MKKLGCGYIYEICDGEFWYIGMTTRDPNIRFNEHTTDEKCVVYRKMTNPKMKILGKWIANTYRLRKIESEYILFYKRIYGDKLINELGKISSRYAEY